MPDYPIPKFHFQVQFSSLDVPVSFTEVSGLETESQIIEYRTGNGKKYEQIKMPGLTKFANITLKRGIVEKSSKVNDWLAAIQDFKNINRETVTIRLLDEENKPMSTWTVSNAWTAKITTSESKADGNEVAIESMELVHEGISVITES